MSSLTPLQPVTGGVVDPEDLVGRAREHREVLAGVAQGGAYLVGDRRMGKTSLLRKVTRDLRQAGHLVVSVSAETSSLDTFTEGFLAAIRQEAALRRGLDAWSKKVIGEITVGVAGSGFRVSGALAKNAGRVEDDLLTLCARAAERAGAASLVLVIDEIAVLANHLRDGDSAAGAEFLRTLRRLRQAEVPRVSVVLAGSVGLHHAVDDKTVLNDLRPRVHVGPMAENEAVELARRLLIGVRGTDDEALAREIARETSNVAFYIQNLIASLGISNDWGSVSNAVDQAIDRNEWEADNYVQRIPRYYDGAETILAFEILDGLASAGSHSLSGIARDLAVRVNEPPNDHELAALLERLVLDHYLVYSNRKYEFATPLLRRMWSRTRERLR